MLSMLSHHNPLTVRLALALLAATLGTWFTAGLVVFAVNVPQYIIQDWVRSVKCQRLGGAFLSNYTNTTGSDETVALWCGFIPPEDLSQTLRQNTELSTIWALCSSMVCVGAMIGSLVTGPVIRLLGVKRSLICGSIILTLGCVMCSLSPLASSWEVFLTGRIIVGIGLGVSTVVGPVYTGEIAPVSLRGAAGTLPTVMSILGLLTITSISFPSALGTEAGWPWLISIAVIPAVISCIALPFCPESPRFLYMERNDKQHATEALVWFRQTSQVKEEIEELHMEIDHMHGVHEVSMLRLFTDPYLRKITILTAIPMLVHQLCGCYSITFYSTAIFESVGLHRLNAVYATLGVWCCYLVAALISMFLIDRAGRRTLMLISQGGMIVALSLFVIFVSVGETGVYGMQYGSAVCIPLFIAFFAVGMDPIPWILPGDLFPQEAHSAAARFSSLLSWGSAMLVTFLFPIIEVAAKQYTFLIFIGFLVLGTVHVAWKLPETKGKTIDEIQMILRGSRVVKETKENSNPLPLNA
ncbi:solute carrier family 2, facilitated glucose transporter member 1-like [Paramacrobiotus metropolitanus]|uniref:solute carrier family 2, facilitated glucose transporter member 1-like n=1 Tax=Paramacrobiotus metropolitanus TaxID=2943436 RepID=UPI0024460CA5|nr:solute carrier family 2, facilitated glucose transporter member 1-like [Paramacrobiotus metropolitanus]